MSNEIHTQQSEYQMTIKEKRTKPTQKKKQKSVCGNTIYTLKTRREYKKKNTSGITKGNTTWTL